MRRDSLPPGVQCERTLDYLAARHGLTPEQVQGLRGLEPLVKATLTE
jgi:hypothetical protein